MELIVLGAGPAYTDRRGALGASYLVRHETTSLVLDLGQGAFPELAAEIDPSRLDGVCISHLHPDHWVDLVALRHYLRWEFQPPRRVAVIAPTGLAERLDGVSGEAGFAADVFDLRRVEDRAVGTLEVAARRVTHTDESYGFRVAASGAPEEHGLVYSGDCGVAEDLDPLVRPGDTLLVEVAFGPGPVPDGALHLDGPAVGRLAARTGAGRVLLTHIQMGYDREATLACVREIYDGPVGFVDPGVRLTV